MRPNLDGCPKRSDPAAHGPVRCGMSFPIRVCRRGPQEAVQNAEWMSRVPRPAKGRPKDAPG